MSIGNDGRCAVATLFRVEPVARVRNADDCGDRYRSRWESADAALWGRAREHRTDVRILCRPPALRSRKRHSDRDRKPLIYVTSRDSGASREKSPRGFTTRFDWRLIHALSAGSSASVASSEQVAEDAQFGRLWTERLGIKD